MTKNRKKKTQKMALMRKNKKRKIKMKKLR
jgi:hypothetical protein